MTTVDAPLGVDQLLAFGFAHLEGPFDLRGARAAAERIADEAEPRNRLGVGMPELLPVGEYVIPPKGAPRRDFQVLHLDFGLPIEPDAARDVARYTALHVPPDRLATSARTRVVSLAAVLGQRNWPAVSALIARLVDYGSTQATEGSGGYVEGILARLVEAADGTEPSLPSTLECLCGEEVNCLADEQEHFAARGMCLARDEVLVHLQPGQLLVLDNLAAAHGRLGRRQPEELQQLMLGHPQLSVHHQGTLRNRVLQAFSSPSSGSTTAVAGRPRRQG